METMKIEASPRKVIGKQVKTLRQNGLIPAVLYGQGVESSAIQMDGRELERLLTQAGGSTLIDLSIGKDAHKVLLRSVQRDPITLDLIHVDFLKVAMDVTIRTYVPIELVGEAPAVKELGGVLVTGLSEIEVEALPSDLVDRISVDLEVLKGMDDSITVGDLFPGKNVTVLTDPDEVVAHMMYQVIEEEEEEVVEEIDEALAAAEPEIVGREEGEEPEESTEE